MTSLSNLQRFNDLAFSMLPPGFIKSHWVISPEVFADLKCICGIQMQIQEERGDRQTVLGINFIVDENPDGITLYLKSFLGVG